MFLSNSQRSVFFPDTLYNITKMILTILVFLNCFHSYRSNILKIQHISSQIFFFVINKQQTISKQTKDIKFYIINFIQIKLSIKKTDCQINCRRNMKKYIRKMRSALFRFKIIDNTNRPQYRR